DLTPRVSVKSSKTPGSSNFAFVMVEHRSMVRFRAWSRPALLKSFGEDLRQARAFLAPISLFSP
ncbi:MAG TPA: hypothetical protein VF772_03160, partial [Terriglobales bacterium]